MVLAQYVRVIILLAGSKTVYSCMYKVGVCNSNEHINTEYVPYVLVFVTMPMRTVHHILYSHKGAFQTFGQTTENLWQRRRMEMNHNSQKKTPRELHEPTGRGWRHFCPALPRKRSGGDASGHILKTLVTKQCKTRPPPCVNSPRKIPTDTVSSSQRHFCPALPRKRSMGRCRKRFENSRNKRMQNQTAMLREVHKKYPPVLVEVNDTSALHCPETKHGEMQGTF